MSLAHCEPILSVADDEPAVTTLGLVEVMLKDPGRLDGWMADGTLSRELVPRFLAVGMAGFAVFGVAETLVLNAAGEWPRWVPAACWPGVSIGNLTLAYVVGLEASLGICLPSFFFFGLLSGLKLSLLQVTGHAAKVQAESAVVLVGILPLYLALALGMIVFGVGGEWLGLTHAVGLALPFVAGLWGVRSLFQGFDRLAAAQPPGWAMHRGLFLRRLTLAWAALYTAVTPVMIDALWRQLSG